MSGKIAIGLLALLSLTTAAIFSRSMSFAQPERPEWDWSESFMTGRCAHAIFKALSESGDHVGHVKAVRGMSEKTNGEFISDMYVECRDHKELDDIWIHFSYHDPKGPTRDFIFGGFTFFLRKEDYSLIDTWPRHTDCHDIKNALKRELLGICHGVNWREIAPAEAATMDVNMGREESRPLHSAAAHSSDARVVEALVRNGAVVNPPLGNSPLHWAALNNPNPGVIRALLESGADINSLSADTDAETPLHWAALNNPNPEALDVFLSHGADVNVLSGHNITPLHSAARRNVNPEITAMLLSRGADIEARDVFGRIPLHFAAQENANAEVLEELLSRGADIEARDVFGMRALHFAAQNAEDEVLEKLLSHGPDVDARDNLGRSPLHFAARNNGSKALALLLWHGADIAARTDDGQTALHWAAAGSRLVDWRNYMNLDVLLAHGADAGATDKAGRTALDVMEEAVADSVAPDADEFAEIRRILAAAMREKAR